MVTIVIGRDHQTNQLYRKANGKVQLIKQEKPVPTSVSKEHVSLTITDDGKVVLKNLNVQNYTYVNMVGIESKLIREGDRIELGPGHYVLDWNIIKGFIPKFADIRPLKKVWEDYQGELMALTIKEKRFGILRGATGLITTAAVILGFVTGRDNPLFIVLYVVAGVISALFFIKAYSECDKAPKRAQEIKDAFPRKYVCPNCGHFLENRPYDVLAQDTKCRYCQVIFKK